MATKEWPEAVERVSSYLRETRAEVRIEEFPEGTSTAKDAARAAGCHEVLPRSRFFANAAERLTH